MRPCLAQQQPQGATASSHWMRRMSIQKTRFLIGRIISPEPWEKLSVYRKLNMKSILFKTRKNTNGV